MKSVIFASLLASAAAFAPQQSARSASVATNMAFENELGALMPLGFYDPLGLVDGVDQARFDRLRFVELKHGRVAMLAVVGYLVNTAGIRFPGNIALDGTKFTDIPSGFAAIPAIPIFGITQIIVTIAFLEGWVMKDATGQNEFVGDFRNGIPDFGWDKFDEETKLAKRTTELNNGRAAMMGILGLMVHEKLGVNILPIV
jgi:Chlorophyll A-B binding protein